MQNGPLAVRNGGKKQIKMQTRKDTSSHDKLLEKTKAGVSGVGVVDELASQRGASKFTEDSGVLQEGR